MQASLASYDIIGKKNVFRPQRKEWTAPPPPKRVKRVKKVKSKPAPPPPDLPPPLPNPAVMGIIVEDDGTRIAIMQGHKREDVVVRSFSRRKTRRRQKPRSRIVADKIGTYHVGDSISEAVIVAIEPNKVVIERDGKEIELILGEKSSEDRSPPAIRKSVKKPKAASPYLQPDFPIGEDAIPPPALPHRNLTRSERLDKIRKSRNRRNRQPMIPGK